MLSKKDIIVLNQNVHKGHVVNPGSLDYAVKQTERSKNWLKSCAIVVRAILVDHIFEDGNKRTAAAAIIGFLESNGFYADSDKVNKIVAEIAKKNIKDIKKIQRLIKNVI